MDSSTWVLIVVIVLFVVLLYTKHIELPFWSDAPAGVLMPKPVQMPQGTVIPGPTTSAGIGKAQVVQPIMVLYKGLNFTGDSYAVYDVGAEVLFANQAAQPTSCKTPNRTMIYQSIAVNPGTVLEFSGTTSGGTDRVSRTMSHNIGDINSWIMQDSDLYTKLFWYNDSSGSWCYWDRPFRIKVLKV